MDNAATLLRSYLQNGDEDSFRQLVARYFDFVHGVALRRLGGNPTHARDVLQIVFTDLAREAAKLRNDTQLGGWLHSHTCYVAAKFVRTETRRAAREQTAAAMNSLDQSSDDPWPAIAPVIDEALQDLSEPDRSAILLRYFEGRDLRSVGETLRISEDAAQKRVQRAIEKLKAVLETKGVPVSVAALGGLLLANASPACQAAPIDAIATAATSAPVSAAITGAQIVGAVVLLGLLLGGFFLWFGYKPNSGSVDATVTAPPPLQTAQPTEPKSTEIKTQETAIPVVADTNALLLHVLNKSTGHPIPSANVRVSTATTPRPLTELGPGDFLVVADAKGVARISVPQPIPSRLLLETYAHGFASWLSIWEKAKDEIIPTEFTVNLDPGVQIGGRVIDEIGNPIAGASIRFGQRGAPAIDRSHQRMVMRYLTNRTDSAGMWFANHIPESLLETISMTFDHPEHARTNQAVDARTLPPLRERNHVVTMLRGVRVVGRVTDSNGQPVVGANVSFAPRNSISRKQTETDANGAYELKGLALGPAIVNIVSVMSANFAPETKSLTNADSSGALNFVLQPGATIRGRVQNPQGEPLKGVRVVREGPDSSKEGIDWRTETDQEGRFTWTSAPHSPQPFYFGYFGGARPIQLRNKILEPRDEEHVIVIQEPSAIKGTVKNADSGQPIDAFFVMPAKGSPERLSSWSPTSERPFKNGAFELHLDEAEYNVLRVRAPGFIGGNFAVPLNNQLDIHLKPAGALEGVVLDSNGRPVAAAEVVALGRDRDHNATLTRGHLSRETTADHTRTDENGRFKLELTADAEIITALHQTAGYGQQFLAEFAASKELRLLPWGRIEGTFLSNSVPLANQELTLDNFSTPLRLDSAAFQTTTDGSGRFTIDTVPPINMHLHRFRDTPPPGRIPAQTNFTVLPGSVTYIELDAANTLPRPSR